MPVYYFDISDGQQVDFEEFGVELRGPEAAFEEAIRGARDMLRDTSLKRRATSSWAYQVRGESGKTLFTVPFSIAAVDRHYVQAWRTI